MIMSNNTPLTRSVLDGEQCGLAGVPDDHEQSGAAIAGAGTEFPVQGAALTRWQLHEHPLHSDRRPVSGDRIITKRKRWSLTERASDIRRGMSSPGIYR
jgi:hypothetical protein